MRKSHALQKNCIDARSLFVEDESRGPELDRLGYYAAPHAAPRVRLVLSTGHNLPHHEICYDQVLDDQVPR
jgi:hypothetical protein